MSLLQLLSNPAGRNLPDVLAKLPHMGVGSKVTRKAWQHYGNSFWEVTRVKPRSADGKVAKVWGVLTWRGKKELQSRQINGRNKKLWRWVPDECQEERLKLLAQELFIHRQWQQLSLKQSQSAGSDSSSSSAEVSSGS